MALNLNTLTSPATSADVLAEVLTTADFLEPVPVLRNLSRGSNKGGDAKQDVALNQPKALPLIDGDGYLYCPSIGEQGATVDSPVLPSTGDFDIEIDFIFTDQPLTNQQDFFAQYNIGATGRFFIGTGVNNSLDRVRFFWQGTSGDNHYGGTLVKGQRHVIRVTRIGTAVEVYLDGTGIISLTVATNKTVLQVPSRIGHSDDRGQHSMRGAIFSVTEGSNFECDFNATNVRHNDTKFKCATNQIVTINQDSSSSNDVATIIKKPVLRFSDAANTGLQGLLNQTIDSGYMFAAYSVLGDGGDESGRLFEVSSDDAASTATSGLFVGRVGSQNNVAWYNAGWNVIHDGLFDDANGDILHEFKFANGSQVSRVNNADTDTRTLYSPISAEEFAIGMQESGTTNVAIDLEFLALFSADSVPDEATASKIRNYVNSRNQIYLRHQTDGYYFFDPQSITDSDLSGATNRLTGSWEGRIVGSDYGDTSRTAYNGTEDDQPTSDKYKLTFADNADNLSFSITQAGWQVVGTSLGTFAYRVDNSAQTEINLLGYASHTRKVGDLYGIILLPESATGADIEAARKLLIDRGAADGATGTTLASYFRNRDDILEFYPVDTSNITQWNTAFRNSSLTSFPDLDFSSAITIPELCKNTDITSFPLVDTSNVTNANQAFYSCTQLSSFPALDLSQCNSFTSTWDNCSALTSFPSDALLGTEANNVNFQSAWQNSGLTSFPPLDLSTGTNFAAAFQSSDLTSFPAGINMSNGTNFANTWRSTDLTSFITPIVSGTNLNQAFYLCGQLTDFSSKVLENWNPASVTSGVFHNTWKFCTALTAQSVENILTSIVASGQHGTDDGTSTGNPLGDSGIDIDYDVATGSLSAATNSAIDSLKTKGWSIIVNNVTL